MYPKPPKSVPGPFRTPLKPPAIPAQSLPSVRYYVVRGGESLGDIAERYYGNPREAVTIFNANRMGVLRADRTNGFLGSPNDSLTPGTTLLIP